MRLPFYTFTGARPRDGYRWQGDELTDGLDEAAGDLLRALDYEPTDPIEKHPALFREFASLDVSPDAIKGFADQHGAIAGERRTTLKGWADEIAAMRYAVALADAIKAGDLAYLKRYVRWETEADSPEWQRIRQDLIDNRDLSPELAERILKSFLTTRYAHVRVLVDGRETKTTLNPFELGLKDPREAANDLIVAGYVLLLQMVNAQLMPSLMGGRGLVARLSLIDGERGVWLQLEPDSLLAALWLQFARVLMDGRDVRRCENPRCGRWFVVSTEQGGGNRNRKYCPDRQSCKVEAWRERQREGKRTRKGGRSGKA
jgi:hypothetical protein